MSREYDLYLREHRENVKKGFEWLKENLPDLVVGNKWDNPELIDAIGGN